MAQNFFVDRRKQVKQGLLNFLMEHKDEDRKKMLALFSLNTGYAIKTLEKYVEELEIAELL